MAITACEKQWLMANGVANSAYYSWHGMAGNENISA
jgi:hypothetical protein